jgi:hypothetical protein
MNGLGAVQRGAAEPRRRVPALQTGGWKAPLLFLRRRPALEKASRISEPGKREEPLPDEHPFGSAYAGGPARGGR